MPLKYADYRPHQDNCFLCLGRQPSCCLEKHLTPVNVPYAFPFQEVLNLFLCFFMIVRGFSDTHSHPETNKTAVDVRARDIATKPTSTIEIHMLYCPSKFWLAQRLILLPIP